MHNSKLAQLVIIALYNRYRCLHFADEKTEVQGGKSLPRVTQLAYSRAELDTLSETQPEVWTVKINKGNLTKVVWRG